VDSSGTMVVVVRRVGMAWAGRRVGELNGAEEVHGARSAGGADANSHTGVDGWVSSRLQPGAISMLELEQRSSRGDERGGMTTEEVGGEMWQA